MRLCRLPVPALRLQLIKPAILISTEAALKKGGFLYHYDSAGSACRLQTGERAPGLNQSAKLHYYFISESPDFSPISITDYQ